MAAADFRYSSWAFCISALATWSSWGVAARKRPRWAVPILWEPMTTSLARTSSATFCSRIIFRSREVVERARRLTTAMMHIRPSTSPKDRASRAETFMFLSMDSSGKGWRIGSVREGFAHGAVLVGTGFADEGGHVEDQGHLTAAQDGGAADGLQAGKELAQGLDDGLELAVEDVHHEAGLLLAGADHHH